MNYNLRELWPKYQKLLMDKTGLQLEAKIENIPPTWDGVDVAIHCGDKRIGQFELREFEVSGPDIWISQRVYVWPDYERRGIGGLLNKWRCEAVGDGMLLCTVNNTNAAQHAILLRNGWRRIKGIDAHCSLWVYGGF